MKKYVTYEVMPVDENSPVNNEWIGLIKWFDGEHIVEKRSEALDDDMKCWEWITKELKEL